MPTKAELDDKDSTLYAELKTAWVATGRTTELYMRRVKRAAIAVRKDERAKAGCCRRQRVGTASCRTREARAGAGARTNILINRGAKGCAKRTIRDPVQGETFDMGATTAVRSRMWTRYRKHK
eukprot:4188031-Prymnesium_polylepis.1